MEERTLSALLGLAAFIGFFHTLIGPDHYVPFIAMARVGGWSLVRTMGVTWACGAAHVLSSVLLGGVGIALGLAVERIERVEGIRGDLACWLLIGFGLAYTVWGVRRALRGFKHVHVHAHADGTVHSHDHHHGGDHVHVHTDFKVASSMTPWILFTIFVFGPCEPLVPILMYPAAARSNYAVVAVAIVFAASTLLTMTVMVTVGYFSFQRFSASRWERYSHAGAGLAITACGIAIKLGL